MNTTKSITGKTIRLTDERWLLMVEGHPEMAGHLHDVLLTVAAPDIVLQGSADELLAATYNRADKLLVVVYKETECDGFILTAYFTKRIDKILKRKIVWQK
ncbi:hypothetical protein [Parafilimonas terrae]|uniref:Phage-Barnase-EndoU-ColicinE5/D-RelE like nuclease 2 domain-containing protein n=1 Tax=Parafilimonas terrae TaxID=1465490 RepID=A0A1I5VA91_9BACT|nr:hypothetical protein [Parafilimonas terrae]SFQ04448.1 hypothetical protein SAMN05444277_104295 [Parafilimonas terrae]